jgi:hypothetical protein
MKVRVFADAIGALGSATCAIHCLGVPLLLLTGAVAPVGFLSDESFHRAMLWIVLPAGAVAFSLGCWHHKDRVTLLLGATGLLGLALAATALHDASAALIGAHLRNFRLCRTEGCRHER